MNTAASDFCEHEEVRAACLECLAQPQKVTPQPLAAPRATKTPTSENDKISPLGGDLDISMPVEDSSLWIDAEWLPAHAFPHYLRRSGWVYLRNATCLTTRVKASKVIWVEERKCPSIDGFDDAGPGMVIKVNPKTWEAGLDIPLGELADSQASGYRYLRTNPDGSITHYRGGRAITETGEYVTRPNLQ